MLLDDISLHMVDFDMGGGRIEECASVVNVSSIVVIVSTSLPIPVLGGAILKHSFVEVHVVGGPRSLNFH